MCQLETESGDALDGVRFTGSSEQSRLAGERWDGSGRRFGRGRLDGLARAEPMEKTA